MDEACFGCSKAGRGLCQGPIVSVNAGDTRYCCHSHHYEMGYLGQNGNHFKLNVMHNQTLKYKGVYLCRLTFSKLKKCCGKVFNGIKANSLNSLKLRFCDICISAKIRFFFLFEETDIKEL